MVTVLAADEERTRLLEEKDKLEKEQVTYILLSHTMTIPRRTVI